MGLVLTLIKDEAIRIEVGGETIICKMYFDKRTRTNRVFVQAARNVKIDRVKWGPDELTARAGKE